MKEYIFKINGNIIKQIFSEGKHFHKYFCTNGIPEDGVLQSANFDYKRGVLTLHFSTESNVNGKDFKINAD